MEGDEERKEQDLIIVAMVVDDIDGFDDVWMLESRTYAEFSSDFFLVLFFGFSGAFRTKLLDGVDMAAALSLDETNGAPGTTSKDLAPLAVLLCDVGMCSLCERVYGVVACIGRGRGPGL
jgi:hypothetical protein